jgi:predicted phosphodiesterase
VAEPWGVGQAALVPTKRNEVVVSLSDFHVPFQDVNAVNSAVRMVKALNPDRVVLNGDLSDFFQLSRFNKALERMDSLQSEVDEANHIRKRIRLAAPNAVIDEVDGNHDSRIRTYVEVNAGALSSLRSLQPRSLFKYDDLEINWHPGAGFRLRDDFIVKHGTLVRGEAGATAKAELLAAGVSGVSGHTHRLATYRRVGYSTRQWTEQGCLCRLDPDYIVGAPNWTQGCVVIELSRTATWVTEVPYVDGKLRFGGRGY